MELEKFIQYLREHSQKFGVNFPDNLEERKRKELEFHNLDYNGSWAKSLGAKEYRERFGNQFLYSITEPSKKYVNEWLKRMVPGKVFLDYACGYGGFVSRAAQLGAVVAIGIDISNIAITEARAFAEKKGVADKTFFIQADCENTGFPDESIDVVICSGMLHHLDLSYAFPELRRILKPGGRLLAIEALNVNPLFQLYRYLTPKMRTEWEKEHILSKKDINFARRFFKLGEIRFWYLVSLISAFLPNWVLFIPIKKALQGLDSMLLRIPGLRLMAWQFTFELIKT